VNLITEEGHKDPHIWLDPVIAMDIVRKIQHALSTADPKNSKYYEKNASAYIERLAALNRQIAEQVQKFRTKEYVTFHPGWNYFSRRYGLKVIGVIEEGPGKEPSPRHLGKILTELRKMKAKVVFAEPQFSTRMADAIAREAGAKVLLLDPIGGQKGRETYVELMHYNLSEMQKAMG
jgi:zinc transport system substrate-binding protein